MTLGLPAAVTLPQPQEVIRKDGTRVVAHQFKSWGEEAVGLRRTLTLKSFIFLAPFLLYWVCWKEILINIL